MNKHINVRIQQLLVLAQASPCPRRKFGAMIYDPDTKALIADGYNGAPRGGGHLCGGDHCVRDGLPRSVKAELLEVVEGVREPWGWWVLRINGELVAPSEQGHGFATAGDGSLVMTFTSKEEALEYERATRPDAVKSGTKMELGCHHAEMNAICNAARHGASTEGKWMLVTGEPCTLCAKLIHHAGIVQVVCVNNGYSGANGVKYLEDHGVAVVRVDGPQDPRR